MVLFFNKGITALPRFKKGLLMNIDNNALIDHDVYFSKTAKKMFIHITCFGPVRVATFLHFMFISKVNLVTLTQIISETQP